MHKFTMEVGKGSQANQRMFQFVVDHEPLLVVVVTWSRGNLHINLLSERSETKTNKIKLNLIGIGIGTED